MTAAEDADADQSGGRWPIRSRPPRSVRATLRHMDILFIASVAVITPDPGRSRDLYVDTLGLALEGEPGDYLHSEHIGGAKHFGIWPLSQAAEACFGTAEWPVDHPVPQASVEFEVANAAAVADAARELEAKGHRLLHASRTEPWGQTVARLLSPEDLVVGISYAPSLHD
jgi:catechol 2,3-dioxygenase-like lactoylglutathione lyase family enzyme